MYWDKKKSHFERILRKHKKQSGPTRPEKEFRWCGYDFVRSFRKSIMCWISHKNWGQWAAGFGYPVALNFRKAAPIFEKDMRCRCNQRNHASRECRNCLECGSPNHLTQKSPYFNGTSCRWQGIVFSGLLKNFALRKQPNGGFVYIIVDSK